MTIFRNRYNCTLDMYSEAYRDGKSSGVKFIAGRSFLITNIPAIFHSTSLILKLLALSLFSALVLISCEKDDGPQIPPTIQLIEQSESIYADTTIGFGSLMPFAISAESGSSKLTNLIAFRSGTNLNLQRALDTSMNINSFSVSKSFTKGLADIEYWTFVVRDKNRLSDSVSVIIARDTNANFGPIRFIESVEMSAQNLGTPGSFFSFDSGVYDLNIALNKQDQTELLYYFYGEDENVIASPGANVESGVFEGDLQNWTTRLTTRFIETELQAEDFYAIENDSLLISTYQEGSGKRKAKNLSAGKTFSFKTQDAVFGIFRVHEVEGGEAGIIMFDVKIQDK